MLDISFLPALKVSLGDPVFIGDFWGFVLSLAIAPFLSFWISAVKSKLAVAIGGVIGSFLGFIIILGWAGTLIFDTPLANVDGVAVFFGSVFFCTIAGVVGGMTTDLLLARKNARDYRRVAIHE
ncbi:PTS sucrose transporter subunit IIBC [Tengunoibacter tsumagoiensis]|uniref:PTS EIIC type-1 domain-containing protein n=1 Tax=Tengunoibacter tsumagoiensis TaxID=2014871 RepID=A0A402A5B0_9CHLR|nr:PTS sucrose transporter subunit IIBC [Tengunoibacter tsumagoiensis]GCE14328.1 hypothetical protein KTT_41870 [Tengunoibacter tsumagoiensis]